MAAPSQEESTPFKDSVSSYIRGYWKKVIQEEGDKTIVAYTELIRQFDKNMASISHQISTEVADPALASQIIGEEILSIRDFLAPNSNRIGPSEGPAKSLPADIPQATVKAKKKTYIIPGLPAALDFRVDANASRGTRASTQIPLDSPKTTTTRDARATRASTQKLPDTSPKRLSINNFTAFTKPAPNPVVPSSTPSTTKPLTARQPIKRRRTEPTDSFPRPPSKPKSALPNQATPTAPTKGPLHWADVKNRAFIFLHTDGHYYACVCYGVHGGGRYWFREDPFTSGKAQRHFQSQNMNVSARNRCHHQEACGEGLSKEELMGRIAWRVVMKHEMDTEEGRRMNEGVVRTSNALVGSKAEGLGTGREL